MHLLRSRGTESRAVAAVSCSTDESAARLGRPTAGGARPLRCATTIAEAVT